MSTTTPNPIPDSYRRVTPCLVVQGAAKALEFYAEVFQATERMRFPGPDGRIAHAEIQIGDSVVIVDDEFPERGTNAPPPGGLAGSPSSLVRPWPLCHWLPPPVSEIAYASLVSTRSHSPFRSSSRKEGP